MPEPAYIVRRDRETGYLWAHRTGSAFLETRGDSPEEAIAACREAWERIDGGESLASLLGYRTDHG